MKLNSMLSRRLIVAVLLSCTATFVFSSCEPLRKKFTRQKKKQESLDFIPVLEPQEYPALAENPQANYKDHYAMIKVWYKDMLTAIEEKNVSDKRQKYTISEVVGHIEEMKKLVNAQTQAKLQKLKDTLTYYRTSLDSPLALRNISRIQSDLRDFDKILRNELRFEKVEEAFARVSS